MKILLITSYFLSNCAIANCLRNIINEMHHDFDIDVAQLSFEKQCYIIDNVDITFVDNHQLGDESYSFIENIKHIFSNDIGVVKLLNIVKFVFFKTMRKISLSPKIRYKIFDGSNYKIIKKQLLIDSYDCIISVSAPFSTHYISHRLKNDFPYIKWIAYYFDPFTFNVTEKSSFEKRCNLEYEVLSNSDNIILTPKMMEEFRSCKLKDYLDKSIVCDFPNVVKHTFDTSNSVIGFDSQKINCVFVGNIYSNIRSPEFFLRQLCKTNKNIIFYLVGNTGEDYGVYKNYLKERFVMVGSVPLDEAFKIMNDADILINIGNSMQNQLPSKIFDYISTGKPIVNICKHSNCLTLQYMNKYPLSLNVFEKETINDDDVKKFEDFCKQTKGKKISFEEVEKIFETFTPKYVVLKIKEILKNVE